MNNDYNRVLESILLRQRGQNGPLVAEILEKLSPEAKERLYRVLQELTLETGNAKSKLRRFGLR